MSLNSSEANICFLGLLKLKAKEKTYFSDDWKSKKALTLFKYIVAKSNEKVQKDVLLELLWPESSSDKTHNLHSTIYLLRKDLERFDLDCKINYSKGHYWFERGNCIIDFLEYENLYNKAVEYQRDGNLIKAKRLLGQALALYRGDFLAEDIYKDWAFNLRQHYREVFIDIILRLSTLTADLNQNYLKAADICQQGLEKDPHREELYKEQISFLLKGGMYVEAIKKYQDYTDMLSQEFGLSPSPQIKEIIINFNITESKNFSEIHKSVKKNHLGAFLSDEQTFKLMYELEVRRQLRNNHSFAILKLTFKNEVYKNRKNVLNDILISLRRGDIVCNWDDNKLLILLYQANKEAVQIVKRRLNDIFSRKNIENTDIECKILSGNLHNQNLEKMIN